NHWNFGDGVTLDNRLYVQHAWASAGTFTVALTVYNESNPAGVSSSLIVHVLQSPIHYVSLTATNPVAPFFSWATAATNLQQAVDAAYAGSVILASNGVYQTGVRAASGALSNRVVVAFPVIVRSLNGPGVTEIHGVQA